MSHQTRTADFLGRVQAQQVRHACVGFADSLKTINFLGISDKRGQRCETADAEQAGRGLRVYRMSRQKGWDKRSKSAQLTLLVLCASATTLADAAAAGIRPQLVSVPWTDQFSCAASASLVTSNKRCLPSCEHSGAVRSSRRSSNSLSSCKVMLCGTTQSSGCCE